MLRSREEATCAGRDGFPGSPRLRPGELWDLFLGLSGAALERLAITPPTYETVTWEAAVGRMETRFGEAEAILREPALAEVEEDARQVLSGIPLDRRSRRWPVDSLLARFCYLACRMLEPEVVVETGVAYGASSAFILKALEQNGRGRLHSVDVPSPLRSRRAHWGAVAGVVGDGRWSLHRGASRRVLPGLLRRVGTVDLFLHDSLHTRRNMRREFEAVWPHLRPGGMLVADDVERNGVFEALGERAPACRRVVRDVERRPLSGNAAPVVFGVAVK